MEQRIGELLSRIIPLSEHDVQEILHEQAASNQKFGDIALQLGFCKPEHVLQAWLHQLETRTERVSVTRIGVDAQALAHLNRALAVKYIALPIRAIGNEVLLAVAHVPSEDDLAAIEKHAGLRVKLVLADEAELKLAIERYYPIQHRADGQAA
jgi:hypothetical protein